MAFEGGKMKMSEEEAAILIQRVQKPINILSEDIPDEGPESKLQAKCEKWLNDRGYPFIHDKSKRKNKKGSILDLHIYLSEGRHVVIELKIKGNAMSQEQKETYRKILFLGHEIHEVKSYKRFLEIMEGIDI